MNLWSNKKAVHRMWLKRKRNWRKTEPECNSATSSYILKYPATVQSVSAPWLLSKRAHSPQQGSSSAKPVFFFFQRVEQRTQPFAKCSGNRLFTSIPSTSLPPPSFGHCILQKTVNTVRHRKQVDNNESDCGKNQCAHSRPTVFLSYGSFSSFFF